MVISGTRDFTIETEIEHVFLLNCAEILLLEDAGEVMVVNFFTRTIKIWTIAWKIGTGRGADPLDQLPMILRTIPGVEDQLLIVLTS